MYTNMERLNCEDGVDNDCDTLIDAADPDCYCEVTQTVTPGYTITYPNGDQLAQIVVVPADGTGIVKLQIRKDDAPMIPLVEFEAYCGGDDYHNKQNKPVIIKADMLTQPADGSYVIVDLSTSQNLGWNHAVYVYQNQGAGDKNGVDVCPEATAVPDNWDVCASYTGFFHGDCTKAGTTKGDFTCKTPDAPLDGMYKVEGFRNRVVNGVTLKTAAVQAVPNIPPNCVINKDIHAGFKLVYVPIGNEVENGDTIDTTTTLQIASAVAPVCDVLVGSWKCSSNNQFYNTLADCNANCPPILIPITEFDAWCNKPGQNLRKQPIFVKARFATAGGVVASDLTGSKNIGLQAIYVDKPANAAHRQGVDVCSGVNAIPADWATCDGKGGYTYIDEAKCTANPPVPVNGYTCAAIPDPAPNGRYQTSELPKAVAVKAALPCKILNDAIPMGGVVARYSMENAAGVDLANTFFTGETEATIRDPNRNVRAKIKLICDEPFKNIDVKLKLDTDNIRTVTDFTGSPKDGSSKIAALHTLFVPIGGKGVEICPTATVRDAINSNCAFHASLTDAQCDGQQHLQNLPAPNDQIICSKDPVFPGLYKVENLRSSGIKILPINGDDDHDNHPHHTDNCWNATNEDQNDSDGDCELMKKDTVYWGSGGWIRDPQCGDACDNCRFANNTNVTYQNDSDFDCDILMGNESYFNTTNWAWVQDPHCGDACDNCWHVENVNQTDSDGNCAVLEGNSSYFDFNNSAWIKDPVCGDACISALCGNGIIGPGEVCDKNSQPCTLGGYEGIQTCNATCTGWEDCELPSGSCGDGMLNNGEQCDDGDMSIPLRCGLGACAVTIPDSCVDSGLPNECTVVSCVPGVPGGAETCNNVDDDCNGVVDNGLTQACYTGAAGTENVGACHGGTQTCAAGAWGACAGEVTPIAEICGNGVDDNCNGQQDEGCGGICDTDQDGHMQIGFFWCIIFGPVDDCDDNNAAVHPGATEVCNGIDDNCVDGIDENLGTTTCGVGVCLHTADNCAGGVNQTCNPMQGATTEICNNLDDDCDGSTDEGLGGNTTCGVGACQRTVPTCVNGQTQTCVPGTPAANDANCNGIDDDCDGWIDEEASCPVCGNGIVEGTEECEGSSCGGGFNAYCNTTCCGLSGGGSCSYNSYCYLQEYGSWGPGYQCSLNGNCYAYSSNCDMSCAAPAPLDCQYGGQCYGYSPDRCSLVSDGSQTGQKCNPLTCMYSSAPLEICWNGIDDDCDWQVDEMECTNCGNNVIDSGETCDGTNILGYLGGAKSVAGGDSHTCAQLANGNVSCWGYNYNGQLGDGTTNTQVMPVQTLLTNSAQIAAGRTHGCALISDGTVKCWGNNYYGQLGIGSSDSNAHSTPLSVSGIATAAQVGLGDDHSCAVLSDGTANCWGRNNYGQLGDNSQTQRNAPVSVSSGNLNSTILQISGGDQHSCAVLANGQVYCWGYNVWGQLGNVSTTSPRLTPVRVSGVTGAVQIVAGGSNIVSGYTGGYSCAVLSTGQVKCWGSNYLGTLGIGGSGDTSAHGTPSTVSGITTAVQLAAGGNHVCALLSDHSIKCWGANYYGQVGNGGTGTRQTTPVSVYGITNAVNITAGWQHTCAVLADGSTWCWGYNGYGQIGDGTYNTQTLPVKVQSPPPTCLSLGFPNGTLTCNNDCSGVNASVCGGTNVSVCGNGIVEGTEQCEGSSCNTFGQKCNATTCMYGSASPDCFANCSNTINLVANYSDSYVNCTEKNCTVLRDINFCLDEDGINVVQDDMDLSCRGHTLTGNGSSIFGMMLNSRTLVTITDCHLRNFTQGFVLIGSNVNRIEYSSAANISAGAMLLSGSSDNAMSSVSLLDSLGATQKGVLNIDNSSSRNLFENASLLNPGLGSVSSTYGVTVSGGTGNQFIGIVIKNFTFVPIRVSGSSYTQITNSSLDNNLASYGIWFDSGKSSNSVISNSLIIARVSAISIVTGNNMTVDSNTIYGPVSIQISNGSRVTFNNLYPSTTGASGGLGVDSGSFMNISNNLLTGNNAMRIALTSVARSIIDSNTVIGTGTYTAESIGAITLGNQYGAVYDTSFNNTFSNNYVYNYTGVGIGIYASNNILINNTADAANRDADYSSSLAKGARTAGFFIYGMNNTLLSNIAKGNDYGFVLAGRAGYNYDTTTGNTLRNNDARNSAIYSYIVFPDTPEASVSSLIGFNTYCYTGVNCGSCRNQDIDASNLGGADGKPFLYVNNQNDYAIQDTDAYSGMEFCNVNGLVVDNVDVSNGAGGIVLINSSGASIINSNISNHQYGLVVSDFPIYWNSPPSYSPPVRDITISGNTLDDNAIGIYGQSIFYPDPYIGASSPGTAMGDNFVVENNHVSSDRRAKMINVASQFSANVSMGILLSSVLNAEVSNNNVFCTPDVSNCAPGYDNATKMLLCGSYGIKIIGGAMLNITYYGYKNLTDNNVTSCSFGLSLGSDRSNVVGNIFNGNIIALSENVMYSQFYYNRFYNSRDYQISTGGTGYGTTFNTTVGGVAQGNCWDDILKNGLDITDLNHDGWGDSGTDYPYGNANAQVAVPSYSSLQDWGPLMGCALGSICGNSVTEGTEVCDGNSRACTVNGYAGTQTCNARCNGWNACSTMEFCGDGILNDGDGEQCDDGSAQTPIRCGLGACRRTVADSCVNCMYHACTPGTPAADDASCNGIDNDCNGQVDEDYAATPTTCGVGACAATGASSCVNGHVVDSCTPGTPIPEVCDGVVDDSCDGTVDEGCACTNGQTRSCGSDVGECQMGTQTCAAGVWGTCDGEITPSAEICDGNDNDCNGLTDENLGSTNCGLGVCAHTIENCIAGVPQTCNPMEGSSAEVCEGSVDEDCDGTVDDGCACTNGQTRACGSDVGECEQGTQTCVGGQWAAECFGEITPSAEVCDGLDNDCTGFADDYNFGTTTCGLGACYHTIDNCVNGQTQTCNPMQGSSPEVCEGTIDQDCDGIVDNGCACTNGNTQSCGSDIGECQMGTQTCVDGQWNNVCVGEVTPSAEVCDGLDNDCSGVADDYNFGQTTCGLGACLHTIDNCASGQTQTCDPMQGSTTEVCEGSVDEDCDGFVDDGCACTNGQTRACGSSVGECEQGTQTCVGGQWAAECAGEVTSSSETCDGLDNDCDGVSDDGLTRATTCGLGICSGNTGTETCTAGAWGGDTCDPLAGAGVESCNPDVNNDNDIDENCDGTDLKCGFTCDRDNDGYRDSSRWYCFGNDCDDNNGAVHPGATEVCNSIDDDCDAGTADGSGESWLNQATTCGLGVCASTGTYVCSGGVKTDTCTAGSPTGTDNNCNGVDEDCSGTNDNNYVPVATNCGTGACARTGTTSCAAGIVHDSCTPGASSPEVCDGVVDESCDGTVDEGCACTNEQTQPCGSDIGECQMGTQTCVAGQWAAECFGEVTPSAEICDGNDNDCNGMTDEGLGSTSCGLGVCAHTVDNCVAGVPQTCDPMQGSSAEVCEGSLDEDCDGVVDDGCACTNGQTRACGSSVGECKQGTQACVNGQWAAECAGEITPSAEVCDGKDNDCSGVADDYDFGQTSCGKGACWHTIDNCIAGVPQTCDPMQGSSAEICEGTIDQDCDGIIDNGCACTNGNTQSCGSDIGECQMGTQTCVDGQWNSVCAGEITPSAEVCDGLDNDCTGVADDYNFGQTTCGLGACLHTIDNCAGGATQTCDPMQGSSAEVCDGLIDQNCDGTVDEGCACINGQTRACGSSVGECEQGTQTCVAGQWAAECVGEVTSSSEVCDGLDNDCDGVSDDGLTRATTCGLGACEGNTGYETCTAGAWGSNTCDPFAGATPETCDAGMTDNDCDGDVNEDCACVSGQTVQCGATDAGECSYGLETCDINGQFGDCVGAVYPAGETCNNLDDDCDGVIDDGVTRGTTCGQGICAGNTGYETCTAGAWGSDTCNPYAGAVTETCNDNTGYDGLDNNCDGIVDLNCGSYCDADNDGYTTHVVCLIIGKQLGDCNDNNAAVHPGATEICNNIDDDCDSELDEDLEQNCYTGAAGTENVGACHGGTQWCAAGVWGTCDGEVIPAGEICNNVDDDCDGGIDEGGICQECGNGVIEGTEVCDGTNLGGGGVPQGILSAGYTHTCAVLSDGTAKCWGYNANGPIGDGTKIDRWTPVSVSGMTNAVQISTSAVHTCAVLSDGTAKCWGWNQFGQLGDGTNTQRLAPVSVSGITNAVQISAGSYHTCAVLSDGTAKCWGHNGAGKLGDGTGTNSNVPVSVSGITNAAQISAGDVHSCAVLSDHTIKCWGDNSYGQFGDGTTAGSYTPVSVLGITNAVQVTMGDVHTCALLSDNTIKCWGGNSYGQLGDGTTTQRLTPVSVSGISNAVQVSAGRQHTCALLSDNTIKCWGNNEDGGLGDGTTTNRLTPVLVSGISDGVQMDSGFGYTCAVLSDGTAKCWGYNYYGKLGDGTQTRRLTPVSVLNYQYGSFGPTCKSLGFLGGTLACSGDCLSFDTNGCYNQLCGNGNVEGTEVCDGGSQACMVGGYHGMQGCNAQCTGWNDCSATESCGDGIVNNGESCDGGDCCNSDCTFKTSAVECRASAGVCDLAESCTGLSATCPADAKSTAECRASAGVCDVAESCDGIGNSCPNDLFKSSSVECRTSAGECDVAESCTGSSATCPIDAFKPLSTVCTLTPPNAANHCNGLGACVCNPSTESCEDNTGYDGKDNNCDGTVDLNCNSYCDVDGDGYKDSSKFFCFGNDCDDGNAMVHPGATEVCNNVDDNCNSELDEDLEQNCYTGAPGTENVGACHGGTQWCAAGVWGTCDGEVTSAGETCNNIDDDCDGTVDDGLTRGTTCGLGACAGNTGTETCTAGAWGGNTCNPFAGASVELCDAGMVDEDCDGSKNEDCNCYEGQTQNCGPSTDAGECVYGTQTCDLSGTWGDCTGAVYPAGETCDNLDNDCDGSIDDGVTRGTTCGAGECEGNTGTETCTAGAWGGNTCDPYAGAVTESCEDNTGYDGLDNNCDGTVDLNCGSYCDKDGDGYTTHLICVFTGKIIGDCDDNNAAVHPGATELCNGFDDNCNGFIDEGGVCDTSSPAVVTTVTPDVVGTGATITITSLITDSSGVESAQAIVKDSNGNVVATVDLTLTSGNQNSGTWTGSYTFPAGTSDGNYTISVTATDIWGNSGTVPDGTVMLDRTAPVTTLTPVDDDNDGEVTAFTLSASDSGSGVDKIYYSIDGGAMQIYTGQVPISAGSHNVTYYSVDKAGNTEQTHSTTLVGESCSGGVEICNGLDDDCDGIVDEGFDNATSVIGAVFPLDLVDKLDKKIDNWGVEKKKISFNNLGTVSNKMLYKTAFSPELIRFKYDLKKNAELVSKVNLSDYTEMLVASCYPGYTKTTTASGSKDFYKVDKKKVAELKSPKDYENTSDKDIEYEGYMSSDARGILDQIDAMLNGYQFDARAKLDIIRDATGVMSVKENKTEGFNPTLQAKWNQLAAKVYADVKSRSAEERTVIEITYEAKSPYWRAKIDVNDCLINDSSLVEGDRTFSTDKISAVFPLELMKKLEKKINKWGYEKKKVEFLNNGDVVNRLYSTLTGSYMDVMKLKFDDKHNKYKKGSKEDTEDKDEFYKLDFESIGDPIAFLESQLAVCYPGYVITSRTSGKDYYIASAAGSDKIGKIRKPGNSKIVKNIETEGTISSDAQISLNAIDSLLNGYASAVKFSVEIRRDSAGVVSVSKEDIKGGSSKMLTSWTALKAKIMLDLQSSTGEQKVSVDIHYEPPKKRWKVKLNVNDCMVNALSLKEGSQNICILG
jgi:alpha-tubulin suppressor-like RCC1 family protein